MREWQPIVTAPTDGRWICVLRALPLAGGGPWRAIPELLIIRRHRKSPDSSGYWSSVAGRSVADSQVEGSLWADIEALPLHGLYEASKAVRSS